MYELKFSPENHYVVITPDTVNTYYRIPEDQLSGIILTPYAIAGTGILTLNCETTDEFVRAWLETGGTNETLPSLCELLIKTPACLGSVFIHDHVSNELIIVVPSEGNKTRVIRRELKGVNCNTLLCFSILNDTLRTSTSFIGNDILTPDAVSQTIAKWSCTGRELIVSEQATVGEVKRSKVIGAHSYVDDWSPYSDDEHPPVSGYNALLA